ncbi:MAG: hypothetical protein KIT10_04560 [Flavobacteriales bacterium]|nr:hypothetical protein [Flavobacteriales bacterium]
MGAALLVLLLAGCRREPVPPPIAAYEDLRARFDVARPGFGAIDYPGFPEGDVSKAYAMVLQAELNRVASEGDPLSELGRNASDRLLRNASTDDRGHRGWGLPVAWDAFGDGSENPSNALYTISTALAIEALLDQVDHDHIAPLEAIQVLLDTVIAPFAQGRFDSPSGMIAYSAEPADSPYDCFNPAIAMAGQLQRYAMLFPDGPHAAACRTTADRNMAVLLEHVQRSKAGHWFWHYSITEQVPNDLPHALYIIAGVRNYIRFGGTHAWRFDMASVHGHLNDFIAPGRKGGWHQWPLFREDLKEIPPPRLYDVGIALRYCVEMGEERWSTELAELSQAYRDEQGRYRKCIGCDQVINEYEANLLNGLSHFFLRKPAVRRSQQAAPPHPALFDDAGLPLTDLRAGAIPIAWDIDPDSGTNWARIAGDSIPLGERVPVGAAWWQDAPVVVTRPLFAEGLEMLRVDAGATTPMPLPEEQRSHLFRHLCDAFGQHWLVTYDPVVRKNRLARYDGQGWHLLPEALEIRDHLGYEQQPRMLHAVKGDTLYLAAGRAVFKLHRNGTLRTHRLPVHQRILEMAADEQHVHLLVEHLMLPPLRPADTTVTDALTHGFSVQRADAPANEIELTGFVMPYGLRARGGHVLLSDANDAGQWLELLALDLGRMNGAGAMSLGMDNLEGEVVWSQSYYLTGLLDLLDLDERAGGILPEHYRKAFRERLRKEAALLAARMPEVLRCRAFTVDRSSVLHAVQTGKMLLLAKRLWTAGLLDDHAMERTALASLRLKDHIEVFSMLGDEAMPGEDRDAICLRFPKGCAFPYDGAGLPYNHQNCWAAGALYGEEHVQWEVTPHHRMAADDIVRLLIDRELAPRAAHPERFARPWFWNYWWGTAKAGWRASDGISKNTPDWPGDGETFALARYRTFDAIAVLLHHRVFREERDTAVVRYIHEALLHGGVEPFVLPYLPDPVWANNIPPELLVKYVRFDQQPDLRNAFIAHGLVLQWLLKDQGS